MTDGVGVRRWLELSVEADVEAVEPVSEVFGRLGRGAVVRPTRLIRDDELSAREDPSAPYEITVHLPDDEAAPASIERTERALWHLQAFALRPIGALHVRPIEADDWEESWKAGYQPQRIGRITIVPSWLDEPPATDLLLRLDPGMAFGTGLHPTTRSCLELLQAVEPMPRAVLDVGSGSGVLALAALRLGAERAVCCDTDPLAVEATRRNAEHNGLSERVEVGNGSLAAEPRERFELVLANLVASLLVELAGRLAAHVAPGGVLLASGIIAPRASEVEEALARAGFVVVERIEEADWTSLRLQL
jgi:ribosomal protein L11 methyltransferase